MRILLVEDDEKLNYSLKYQLEGENFTVDSCLDGEIALFYARQGIYDAVLLDRMLPSLDGMEVLKTLRSENIKTPVILITALGELQDKVNGLDIGADDYLVKPFAFEELMARLRSIIRRTGQPEPEDCLSCGNISYFPAENKLVGDGKSCILSKKEGQLLEVFLRSREQTLSRSLLISKVWGYDTEIEDGNLDNYIHFIRRRFRSVNSSVSIRTLRGIGYKLYTGKDG